MQNVQQIMDERRSYPCCNRQRYLLTETRNNMNVYISDIAECWATPQDTPGKVSAYTTL